MRRRRPVLAVVLLAIVLTGCERALVPGEVTISMSPLPANASVHFVNHTSNVLLVGGTPLDGGPGADRLLGPCGGTLTVPVWELTDEGHMAISLLYDDSGRLDSDFAHAGGDPSEMPGHYDVDFVWSSGEVRPDQLPKWITASPTGVQVSDAPPPPLASASCAPWSPAPLESPSGP